MDWPEGKDFGMSPEKEVTHAEEAPPHNKLPANEKQYALFKGGSCYILGKHRRLSSSGLRSSRKMRSYWRESSGGLQRQLEDWSISPTRKG